MGIDGWQWALWLAAWFGLACALCALWTAATRIAGRVVEHHVSRALSSRERVRKSLDMAAGEDR